jgi:hypothetical protein
MSRGWPTNSIQTCRGGFTDTECLPIESHTESNVAKKLMAPTMTRMRPIAARSAPPIRSPQRKPA